MNLVNKIGFSKEVLIEGMEVVNYVEGKNRVILGLSKDSGRKNVNLKIYKFLLRNIYL